MKKEDTASYTAYQLVDFSQTSPSPRPSLDISQTGIKRCFFSMGCVGFKGNILINCLTKCVTQQQSLLSISTFSCDFPRWAALEINFLNLGRDTSKQHQDPQTLAVWFQSLSFAAKEAGLPVILITTTARYLTGSFDSLNSRQQPERTSWLCWSCTSHSWVMDSAHWVNGAASISVRLSEHSSSPTSRLEEMAFCIKSAFFKD